VPAATQTRNNLAYTTGLTLLSPSLIQPQSLFFIYQLNQVATSQTAPFAMQQLTYHYFSRRTTSVGRKIYILPMSVFEAPAFNVTDTSLNISGTATVIRFILAHMQIECKEHQTTGQSNLAKAVSNSPTLAVGDSDPIIYNLSRVSRSLHSKQNVRSVVFLHSLPALLFIYLLL